MPELAEVERSRRLLDSVLVGKTVTSVTTPTEDETVFGNIKPRAFAKMLIGKRIACVVRRGKHIIVETEGNEHNNAYFHQGMTGDFLARSPNGTILEHHVYKEFNVDHAAWPPKFSKCIINLSTGESVAYTNVRRFGRILSLKGLFDDNPKFKKLGPDPFAAMPEKALLVARMQKRKGPIKGILLDQHFLAGIGNWIADEVLYQARVQPTTTGHQLSDDAAGRIVDCVTYVRIICYQKN